jgi:hypothetical protein
MIFIERPITLQHVRDACARFNEGVRVEYKSAFDANVRDKLPKVISSFANSQGGVLIVGVTTANGVPQPPFDGFTSQPREEYPLTVENICVRSIHPPVLPRTQVVQSDVAGKVFLVIGIDESAEAPHAIENSKKVYVRTGNAADPYDLAEVDLIIDLMKRREEPLARRDRLLRFAEQRSHRTVQQDRSYAQISLCPAFPRNELCSSEEVWDFLYVARIANRSFVDPNTMKRIPGGAASLTQPAPRRTPGQYVELGNYGLLFAARELSIIPWTIQQRDNSEQLNFDDLFHALLRSTAVAERFYTAHGYSGSIAMNTSLHNVRGQAMRFVPPPSVFGDNPEDFRCYTDLVSAERLVAVDEIRAQKQEVLTGILAELTWSFWQSYGAYPVDRLSQGVQQAIRLIGS